MSYKVEALAPFIRDLKRLSKKYRSLKADMAGLVAELAENPIFGTPLGNDCYKIRLAITSKGRGKSGGARDISHVKVSGRTVYLLDIYDKSESASLSSKEIGALVKLVP